MATPKSKKYLYSQVWPKDRMETADEALSKHLPDVRAPHDLFQLKAEKMTLGSFVVYRIPRAEGKRLQKECSLPFVPTNREAGPIVFCDFLSIFEKGHWRPVVRPVQDEPLAIYTVGKIIYTENHCHVRFAGKSFRTEAAAEAWVREVAIPEVKSSWTPDHRFTVTVDVTRTSTYPAATAWKESNPKEDGLPIRCTNQLLYVEEHVIFLNLDGFKSIGNPHGTVCSWHIKKTEVLG